MVEPIQPQPDWTDGARSLPLVKLHLREDGDARDALIAMQYEAAIEDLEDRLNRSLRPVERTVPLSVDHSLTHLPRRPVTAIVGVEMLGDDGAWAAVPAAETVLLDDHRAHVRFNGARAGMSLRLRYRAGYAELPQRVRSMLLLLTEEKVEGSNADLARAIGSTVQSFRLLGVG